MVTAMSSSPKSHRLLFECLWCPFLKTEFSLSYLSQAPATPFYLACPFQFSFKFSNFQSNHTICCLPQSLIYFLCPLMIHFFFCMLIQSHAMTLRITTLPYIQSPCLLILNSCVTLSTLLNTSQLLFCTQNIKGFIFLEQSFIFKVRVALHHTDNS